ncbi:MAG TPA: DUF2277 domain-containing protein [Rhizomicrobium sp.]|nr:DUF2277 domain-containing protein [Rhizomicrobium sp.]
MGDIFEPLNFLLIVRPEKYVPPQPVQARATRGRSLCYPAPSPTEPPAMCRNIRTLANFAPPATDDEIRASALQFVRKLSGFNRPSKANQAAFDRAIADVTHAAHHLLGDLVSNAPPRDRAVEAAKAKARSAERFAKAAP